MTELFVRAIMSTGLFIQTKPQKLFGHLAMLRRYWNTSCMESKRVRLIQKAPYKWDLVAPKGHILVEGLMFHTLVDAENWCKNYISSFQNWTFKLVPKD